MSHSWLAAESFDRGQRLIQAINTLMIQLKLTMAGIQNAERAAAAERARHELRDFLGHFAVWLAEAEQTPTPVVMGIDPRLHQLVTRVAEHRRQLPRRLLLYRLPMDQVEALLDAAAPPEMEQLLDCLQELRVLLEDHLHADIVGLLGEDL